MGITNENHCWFIGRASESLLLFVFNVKIQPYNQYFADYSEQKIGAMVVAATYKQTTLTNLDVEDFDLKGAMLNIQCVIGLVFQK